MTEATALKALRVGDEGALAWFIDVYTPYVTTIIRNIIGTSMAISDVEEVAADVFVALWQNSGSVHSVKGYLGTVARNMAKNKLRQLRSDLQLDEHILVLDELSPESRIEKREQNAAVKRAVLGMPQPDREIFLRFYYYYQSLETISEEMHLNLSTVKTKLYRGRIRLRKALAWYLR